MNLLTRLFLLVAIAVLPAIAIEAYTQLELRHLREGELRDIALQQARLAAAEIDRIVEGARQLLVTLANSPAVKERNQTGCATLLAAVQGQFPSYRSIAVLDGDGRAWCEGRHVGGILPSPQADYIRRARAGAFAVGVYKEGEPSHIRVLPLAFAVADSVGTTPDVIVVQLDLDWLSDYLRDRPLPAGYSVTAADRDGRILARFPDAQRYVGRLLPAAQLARHERGDAGPVDLVGVDGIERVVGFVPVAAMSGGLFLEVGVPKEAGFAPIERATRLGVLLMALSLGLALALAWLFGERALRRPVAALAAAASRWREGDYAARVPVRAHHSELDELGHAFNTMAATIEMRDRQLRGAEERALREEREFSRLVIESSAEGIVACDRRLTVTLWNPAIAAYFGVPQEAALGRPLVEVAPSLEDTPFAAAMRQALLGSECSVAGEPYELRETGRAGFYDASHAPLRDGDGNIIGAIAFVREVTERHGMEDRLRQSQKMEAVGQLTGGIAHDFNNLLTVIIGNLDLLARRVAGRDGELDRLAEAALRGANRAATLTQRLLAFSRRQPLEPKVVEPNRLITGMSDLLQRTLGETIAVETVLAAGLWRTLVDPNQLENALLNLVINARDAMPGGGKLTIETGNALLDAAHVAGEEHVQPGEYVVIAVGDNGTGMPPEVIEKAFEPFFTTKGVGAGSGLGLSMVYGFVKQSNGHVKIDSAPGRGTTVKLYLPRYRAHDAELGAERIPNGPRMPAPTRAHHRVLLVEDEDEVRAFAAAAMRELGYDVLEARDGGEALALLDRGEAVDLLLADVGLPGMSGRRVAEEAQRRRPGLKVLYTTGYARDAIVHDGVLDADVQVLAKPFDSETLAWKLHQVIQDG
jgi:PAS domain S-box-containing protein